MVVWGIATFFVDICHCAPIFDKWGFGRDKRTRVVSVGGGGGKGGRERYSVV